MGLESFGKLLVVLGAVFIVLGLIFLFRISVPFLGRLPGDIAVQKKNVGFYFPITSCILLSVLFTLLLHFFRKR
jgi:hypothetical protein